MSFVSKWMEKRKQQKEVKQKALEAMQQADKAWSWVDEMHEKTVLFTSEELEDEITGAWRIRRPPDNGGSSSNEDPK
jgi:hypothetical protein